MEEKKVLLSVKDLEVEFRVRGRILTAIRGISLDIYENESIAIVGESAAGKSVFTKTAMSATVPSFSMIPNLPKQQFPTPPRSRRALSPFMQS